MIAITPTPTQAHEHTEAAKDRAALAALFDAQAPFVLRLLERLTGSPHDAEDLLQEVFLIAHRKRDHVAEHPDPRGWLARTAIHLARRHERSLVRRVKAMLRARDSAKATATAHTQGPDATLERREQAAQVNACIQALPLKQREVFVLYELERWEGHAIAAHLDIPEGTVWTRLHHARRRFRERWVKRASSDAGRSR